MASAPGFDWAPNTGNSATITGTRGNIATLTVNNNWLTILTGHLGYAWDRLVIYGKGGFAFVGSSNSHLTDKQIIPQALGSPAPPIIMAGRRAEASNTPFGTIGRRASSTFTSD